MSTCSENPLDPVENSQLSTVKEDRMRERERESKKALDLGALADHDDFSPCCRSVHLYFDMDGFDMLLLL